MDLIQTVAKAIYEKYEDRPLYAQLQMNGVLAEELAIAALEAADDWNRKQRKHVAQARLTPQRHHTRPGD